MSNDLAHHGAEPAARRQASPERTAGRGPRLLPVGTPGGINSGFDGIPAGSGTVRLGRYLVHLEPETYRLWRIAFAAPERDRFVAWARSEGVTDAERRIAELESDDLLIEEGPAMIERVGGTVVRLLGECLGNGTRATSRFQVAGSNGTVLTVNPFLYEILLRSDVATTPALISMPSTSGWALQEMSSTGPSDLRVCTPLRQAIRESRRNGADRSPPDRPSL